MKTQKHETSDDLHFCLVETRAYLLGEIRRSVKNLREYPGMELMYRAARHAAVCALITLDSSLRRSLAAIAVWRESSTVYRRRYVKRAATEAVA